MARRTSTLQFVETPLPIVVVMVSDSEGCWIQIGWSTRHRHPVRVDVDFIYGVVVSAHLHQFDGNPCQRKWSASLLALSDSLCELLCLLGGSG